MWRTASRRNCEREGKIMTVVQATKSKNLSDVTRSGRLFVLELSGDRIHSMNPDGSDRKTIITNCHLPDGIAVDTEAGHVYWTNMGVPRRAVRWHVECEDFAYYFRSGLEGARDLGRT